MGDLGEVGCCLDSVRETRGGVRPTPDGADVSAEPIATVVPFACWGLRDITAPHLCERKEGREREREITRCACTCAHAHTHPQHTHPTTTDARTPTYTQQAHTATRGRTCPEKHRSKQGTRLLLLSCFDELLEGGGFLSLGALFLVLTPSECGEYRCRSLLVSTGCRGGDS